MYVNLAQREEGMDWILNKSLKVWGGDKRILSPSGQKGGSNLPYPEIL